ncbi:hypothetical protein ACE6H2_017188 [Prunus campanulata]
MAQKKKIQIFLTWSLSSVEGNDEAILSWSFCGLANNKAHCASPWSYSESHYTCASEQTDLTSEEGNRLVVSFTGKVLDILHHCLPSTISL